jgi:hypothetical protein
MSMRGRPGFGRARISRSCPSSLANGATVMYTTIHALHPVRVGTSRIGTPGSGPVDVDVLVVGEGGADLSAALVLRDVGVDFLPAERHPASSRAPEAHIINPRTVEIFAQYDFADQVRPKGSLPETFAKTRWYTSFSGGTDRPSHASAVAPSLTRCLDA